MKSDNYDVPSAWPIYLALGIMVALRIVLAFMLAGILPCGDCR